MMVKTVRESKHKLLKNRPLKFGQSATKSLLKTTAAATTTTATVKAGLSIVEA